MATTFRNQLSNIMRMAWVFVRKRNDSVQVYFDTEKDELRCFKLANLLRMA